jgi:hypothetical protein
MFSLAAILLLASTSYSTVDSSNKSKCQPFSPSDSLCGVFAPMKSVFDKEQAQEMMEPYYRQFLGFCGPDLITGILKETLPFFFCLGAMGIVSLIYFAFKDHAMEHHLSYQAAGKME